MLEKSLGTALKKFFCRDGLFDDQAVIHEKRFPTPSTLGVETNELFIGNAGIRIPACIRIRSPGPKGVGEAVNRHSYFSYG